MLTIYSPSYTLPKLGGIKMKKGRSPNYPAITFEDALARVRRVYSENHNYTSSKEVIAQSLGYTSINGGSLTMIGALKAYDLIESDGDGLRVTANAVSIILLPEEDASCVETINACVFHPDIFKEIREKYTDNILPSDTHLKHYLITTKGYLAKAADGVIRVYRANLEFVNALNEKYNADMKSTALQSKEVSTQQPLLIPLPSKFYGGGQAMPMHDYSSGSTSELSESPNPNQELKFRLSPDSDVRLIFRGEVTQEAVTKLMKLLDLSMDTFPTQASLRAPALEIPIKKLEEKFPSDDDDRLAISRPRNSRTLRTSFIVNLLLKFTQH
jgi:hypothetical protein